MHQVGFPLYGCQFPFFARTYVTQNKAYRADKGIQVKARSGVSIYRWKNLKSCKLNQGIDGRIMLKFILNKYLRALGSYDRAS